MIQVEEKQYVSIMDMLADHECVGGYDIIARYLKRIEVGDYIRVPIKNIHKEYVIVSIYKI